jgi:hypothetical protein
VIDRREIPESLPGRALIITNTADFRSLANDCDCGQSPGSSSRKSRPYPIRLPRRASVCPKTSFRRQYPTHGQDQRLLFSQKPGLSNWASAVSFNHGATARLYQVSTAFVLNVASGADGVRSTLLNLQCATPAVDGRPDHRMPSDAVIADCSKTLPSAIALA